MSFFYPYMYMPYTALVFPEQILYGWFMTSLDLMRQMFLLPFGYLQLVMLMMMMQYFSKIMWR